MKKLASLLLLVLIPSIFFYCYRAEQPAQPAAQPAAAPAAGFTGTMPGATMTAAETTAIKAPFPGYTPPELPPLPGPPSPPSASYQLPRSTFADNVKTWGDAASWLEERLRLCEYEEWRYFEIPGGFALVTKMERIEADGRPKPEDKRWVFPDQQVNYFPGSGKFYEYFKKLLTDEDSSSTFRVLVFLVTNTPTVFLGDTIPPATIKHWAHEGLDSLPPEFQNVTFPKDIRCTALIYVFNCSGKDLILVENSSVSGLNHLKHTGIIGGDQK